MSSALITALGHTSLSHHAGPWYIALPVLAVVVGVTIWRRGAEVEAAGSSADLVINDEQGAAARGLQGLRCTGIRCCDRQAGPRDDA
jgi:hypothetical protein